jgi:hypothetical protein
MSKQQENRQTGKLSTKGPYTSRLFRDMRNDLAKKFIVSLETLDWQPVSEVIATYQRKTMEPEHQEYLTIREKKYREALKKRETEKITGTYPLAALLWDAGLFFEVHEYLEPLWIDATGIKKKVLQALIRAAGTYVHLHQGNMTGAAKMAEKAIKTLNLHQEMIPADINIKLLLAKLSTLDPSPPLLKGQ